MIAVLEIDKDVVAVLFQTLALAPRIAKLLIIVFDSETRSIAVLEVQSTLDIAEFSVTQQKSAKSRFSAIRNYFWGQRSNIPQITK